MSLSLITINKNRNNHLLRCLEGAARNARTPDQIVVVEMGESAPAVPPGTVVVNLCRDDLPLARSRNIGRQYAQGETLVFLDVDCIPSTSLFEIFETAAAKHDALICGEAVYLTKPVQDDWTDAELLAQGRRHPARSFPDSGTFVAPDAGLFWSLAFAVRAETFDRLGGFDEGYIGYGGEDTDLAYRAVAAHVPILFISGGCAFHQWHDACDPPLTHCADIVRNANRFHRRHHVWPMMDWLEAFATIGIVAFNGSTLSLERLPTAAEIADHRLPPDRPF